MFYEPGDDASDKSVHGLPHNPFKALVAPRPIGWISTVDANGVANLAPYSFFNALADAPPIVMFSNTGVKPDQPKAKDSVANIVATEEFVANIATYPLRDAMNASSAPLPADVDEFEAAGLEKAPCRIVKAPRVAASPASLECKLLQIVDLPAGPNGCNVMVIGQVVGIHIDDAALTDGKFDSGRVQMLARLGYRDYDYVSNVFELDRPSQR
ncbi:MAG: flavin reductase family protein [Neomegalonema sp.]|nr:flavin reductase family protein [Neomegalonema sp.]